MQTLSDEFVPLSYNLAHGLVDYIEREYSETASDVVHDAIRVLDSIDLRPLKPYHAHILKCALRALGVWFAEVPTIRGFPRLYLNPRDKRVLLDVFYASFP